MEVLFCLMFIQVKCKAFIINISFMMIFKAPYFLIERLLFLVVVVGEVYNKLTKYISDWENGNLLIKFPSGISFYYIIVRAIILGN